MGVDYFPCRGCEEIICDCGEFYSCESCGSFCVTCFEELEIDGFKYSRDYGLESCWYCTKDRKLKRVTDTELVQWLMEISGKSREDYLNHLAEQGEFDTPTDDPSENSTPEKSDDEN